ncbi:MAG: hypothetical protein K6B51_00495 [Bacilli bacterium]|nr:hypothetical protein [Bacilli bacterium]
MKKIFSCFLLTFSCLSITSLGSLAHSKVSEEPCEPKEEETIEVVSRDSLLKAYYDLATTSCRALPKTFDDFIDEYEERKNVTTIQEFALDFADSFGNREEVEAVLLKDKKNLVSGGGGGTNGDSEDYILKSTNEVTRTPASYFARPLYNDIFDYSELQFGDILYEAEGSIGGITGHVALISDPNHASDYGSYVQTIEAVMPCVSYGFIDDNRIIRFNASIYRVAGATYHDRLCAKNFMAAQIGKPYQLHSPCNRTVNGGSWYCSELVWAAYNSVYIDLSSTSGSAELAVTPAEIKNSSKTELLTLGYRNFPSGKEAPCLEINNLGKKGSSWKISVTNPNNFAVTVCYNAKMCFLDDAKEWKNLKNEQHISCAANSTSASFTISENWFADSIGISFVYQVGTTYFRFVSYGKNLSGKSLSQWRNTIIL